MTAMVALLPGCAATQPRVAPTPGPELPASYAGVLPCAGCEGVRTQLDLWPDGVFHLQRVFVGRQDRDDDRGRWERAAGRNGIRLHGGREMPLSFAWRDPDVLVPLDVQGRPPEDSGAALQRLARFAPADLQLALHGEFRERAGTASFEECLTGRRYPVATQGDFAALQRAYRESPAGAAGEPILASFDGGIASRPATDGAAPVPTVFVRRFVGLWPDQSCERAMSRASLAETYWRIVRLGDERLVTSPRQREAHLILHAREGRYKGHFGCHGYAGRYSVEGDRIDFGRPEFSAAAGCTAADPSPAALPPARLDGLLAATRRWTIQAQVLEFFDGSGASLAVLEAVYLR